MSCFLSAILYDDNFMIHVSLDTLNDLEVTGSGAVTWIHTPDPDFIPIGSGLCTPSAVVNYYNVS